MCKTKIKGRMFPFVCIGFILSESVDSTSSSSQTITLFNSLLDNYNIPRSSPEPVNITDTSDKTVFYANDSIGVGSKEFEDLLEQRSHKRHKKRTVYIPYVKTAESVDIQYAVSHADNALHIATNAMDTARDAMQKALKNQYMHQHIGYTIDTVSCNTILLYGIFFFVLLHAFLSTMYFVKCCSKRHKKHRQIVHNYKDATDGIIQVSVKP